MSLLGDMWRKGAAGAGASAPAEWLPRQLTGGSAPQPQPPLCDDLGELEACMGVDDGGRKGGGGRCGSLLQLPGSGRLQRAMQLAHDKMRALRSSAGGARPPAVESSATFAEAERQVGSAEWCGLQCGEDATPTQLAAAQWLARSRAHAAKRDAGESASVASRAETVHEHEHERKPVSSVTHIVSASDNISGLCLRYDISAEELLASNKPATRISLLARKTIIVPVFANDGAEKREDAPPDCPEVLLPAHAAAAAGGQESHGSTPSADVRVAPQRRACAGGAEEMEAGDDAEAIGSGTGSEAVPRRGPEGSAPCASSRIPLPSASPGVRLPSF